MTTTNVQCPNCKGWRVWKKGLTPTLQGRKVRYICAVCGKTFFKITHPAPPTVPVPKAPKAQPKKVKKTVSKAVNKKPKTGGRLRLKLRKTAK